MKYDIAVIGGGTGGYVAAIRGAQSGAKVCLIENDLLGGTCLNRGCIPTKSLLSSTSVYRGIKEAATFLDNTENISPDLKKIIKRKDQVVTKLRNGVGYLLEKNRVDVVNGMARFMSSQTLEVMDANKQRSFVEASNIIIATGSKPMVFPSFNYDGESVITSDELLKLEEIPKSLVIVGGGVVGCEFANIFNELGTKVTVVDVMDNIIPFEDVEISQTLKKAMIGAGIKVMNATKVSTVTHGQNDVTVSFESGESITVEKVLLSIGRTPNTDGLGIEYLGLNLGPRKEIAVNDKMETAVKGVYAVGDVTNKMQLAHVASAQGIVAVNNIMGNEATMDYGVVPSCIFTHPEIGSVGMTAAEAEDKAIQVKEGRFPFYANGKALTLGEGEGFVKLIVDGSTDKVIGAHIIGPHASDLVSEAALAISLGATAKDIADTIHSHPTLSECIHEAAEDVHGLAIHI